MKPFDEGQEREFQYQLSHNRLAGWSLQRRVVLAVALGVAAGASVGLIVWLTGDPWMAFTVCVAVGCLLLQVPAVISPARATRWFVWAMHPSAEEMERGDHNKNWPG
ncbi:MAG: hypothetical protein ACRDWY_07925 [Actinomycetes bacterium]